MWLLKYEYKHKDCKYSPLAKKLEVALHIYPISYFAKDRTVYTTAIHLVEGPSTKSKLYKKYLNKISLKTDVISSNAFFTLVAMKKNFAYYQKLYNQAIFYPVPVIHTGEKEIGQIASWNENPLREIIKEMQKNKNTEYFKILKLKNEPLNDVFLLKLLPKITNKQRQCFERALAEGYYNYPRKINLDGLSKMAKISKSNYHEILRRAESNILKSLPR